MRLVALGVVTALVLTGCGGGPAFQGWASSSAVPTTGSGTTPPVSLPGDGGSIPGCDDFPRVTASPDAYADTPLYLANEMPTAEVQAWARTQPGFETIWIDRDHNGWITVAFSEDAEARQTDLERNFPGVGVVAVAVDWHVADLHRLQTRVTNELLTFLDNFSTGSMDDRGVVTIGVGVLTDDLRSRIEDSFGGERVCLEGRDPSTVPAPGPQPVAGDGWRLLVDEPSVGQPYRTGIATDPESLEALWATIGLDDPPPEVDFITEVVIWFGAVYSGSCPDIRLDNVVVDGSVVHALIVEPNPQSGCTDDANPRAYVVAVERSRLPVGRFVIQLDADGPPAGAPEERTVVDADLSQPGAVAMPGQIGPDPSLPEPYVVESGAFIEPGYPVPYNLYTHCGIEWLGEFNGYAFRTTEPLPPEWQTVVTDETIEVSLLLLTDPEPAIEASAASVTVTYRPTLDPLPGCD